MKILFKTIIFQLVLLGSLVSSTVAYGQGAVDVDHASITQNFDAQEGHLIISGNVANPLPLEIEHVIVRLYAPGPEVPAPKIWEVEAPRIQGQAIQPFTFQVKPNEIASYETFSVQIWQYTFNPRDAPAALKLVQLSDPVMIEALIRALVNSISSDPAIVANSFAELTDLGRLCLIEATLSSGEPRATQYLTELLLTGEKIVVVDLLKDVSALTALLTRPSPFPKLEQWQPTGDPQTDAVNLIKAFPTETIPMLMRMRYIGATESQRFAEGTLSLSALSAIERQEMITDTRTHDALVSVYRELATLFPQNAQFRQALARAELKGNAFFLLLGLIIAVIFPLIFVYWTRFLSARRWEQ